MRRAIILFLCLPLLLLTPLQADAKALVVYRHASSKGTPRVALTFDDGPHPRYTGEILDILEEYGVKATFFAVGENAKAYPELIRRASEEGHEIGNHTHTHLRLDRCDVAEAEREIGACTRVLEEITGRKIRLFRPPEGVCTEGVKVYCRAQEMTILLWSVDTRDWAHTPAGEILKNVRENARNGSIILMHDFIGKNSPTPAVLRQIIPMLQESGYELVTVSQLLEG